jgi:hypothetical protein
MYLQQSMRLGRTRAPTQLGHEVLQPLPGGAAARVDGQPVEEVDDGVAEGAFALGQRAGEAVMQEVERIVRRVGEERVEEDLEAARRSGRDAPIRSR